MQAGTDYLEHHNQVSGIVYRKIRIDCVIEIPVSKWITTVKVIENYQPKIVWDFQIQTDNKVMSKQLDIVVVDHQEKKAVVVSVAILNDSKIRKN